MTQPSDPLTQRLAVLAAELELPGLGPRVADVVSLALDLVLADRDTPATVAVASLGPDATLRDSGEDIREMFREQGFAAAAPRAWADRNYTTALWAFGLGGLSVGEFSLFFYDVVPRWEDQSDLDRQMALLLHDWEQESDVEAREPIEAAMRQLAAGAT